MHNFRKGDLVLFRTPTTYIGHGDPMYSNNEDKKIGFISSIKRYDQDREYFVVYSDGERFFVSPSLCEHPRFRTQI